MSRHLLAAAIVTLVLTAGGEAAQAQADPDINNDGVVNILDVSLVSSCQGMDPAAEFRCQTADTDDDGDIDADDLGFVTGGFGQDGFPPCGDENLDPNEECDDGNTDNNDCCSEFCQIEPRGTACRPVAGACDQAEFCDGENDECPEDLFEPATTTCRPSADICDVVESCTGTGPACPADGFQAGGVPCRAPAGICDLTEVCTGTGPACPADAFQVGVVCRAAVGLCDIAETCSGGGPLCPADGFQPTGTVCRPSAGDCDNTEICSGTGPACPADGFAAAGTPCGSPLDTECTNPDTCDGAGSCNDNDEVFGTACGSPADTDCTDPDFCDGLGFCDPADAAPGTSCGDPSDTECTDPDACDGAGTCEPNHASVGAACGDQGVECLEDDACDGAGACTDNGFSPPTTPCGDPTGTVCSDPDTCDGLGNCDPNHVPASALLICGDLDVECLLPDICDGAGNCQDGGFSPPMTLCGDQGVECLEDDTCDGAGNCVDGGFSPMGAACGNPTDDDCTDPDFCDGLGFCDPADAASGTSCGDPADTECTDPDACDGAGTCAPNHASAGAACGDPADTECSDPDTCDGLGNCDPNHVPTVPVLVPCGDTGVQCRLDFCDGAGHCDISVFSMVGTPCGDPTDDDCTDPDTCDGAGTCEPNHAQDGVVCNPGEPCNTGDCVMGVCQPDASLTCSNDMVDAVCGEECDGTDDAACPGLCQLDCTCGEPMESCRGACEADVDASTFEPACDAIVTQICNVAPNCCDDLWTASCLSTAQALGLECPAAFGHVQCDGRTGDVIDFLITPDDDATFQLVGDSSLVFAGFCPDAGIEFSGPANQDITISAVGSQATTQLAAPVPPPIDFCECIGFISANDALCTTSSTLEYSLESTSDPTPNPVFPLMNDANQWACTQTATLRHCFRQGCGDTTATFEALLFGKSFSGFGVTNFQIIDQLSFDPVAIDLGDGIGVLVEGTGKGCPSLGQQFPNGNIGCSPNGSGPVDFMRIGVPALSTCLDDTQCLSTCTSFCGTAPGVVTRVDSARCLNNLCECACSLEDFSAPTAPGNGSTDRRVKWTFVDNGTDGMPGTPDDVLLDERETCQWTTTGPTMAEVREGSTVLFAESATGTAASPNLCTAQGTELDAIVNATRFAATDLLLNVNGDDLIVAADFGFSCSPGAGY